jgi:hypothetical protein
MGGTGPVDPGVAASFETLKEVIRGLGCFGSDCHGGNEFNPLDLQIDEELYMRLIEGTSMECDGLPYIDPGNPDGSALIRLINGPCGMTGQMPAGCTPGEGGGCVPDAYIEALEQWVANGAQEEE